MVHVVIEHKIRAWSEFEPVFHDDAERRRRLGSKGGTVYRDLKDPEHIFVAFDWDSPQGAVAFIEGLETHEAMKWATSGIWSRVYATEKVVDTDA